MPGVLTKDQQLALIFETSSVQALLRHGVDQLLEVRYVSADIDPVLTTLSIGVEKLMKLTWGLLEVAAGRSWPSKTVMQDQGHGVKSLNELIDPQLGAAVGLPAQPWIQGLRAGVNNDPYWALILSALDTYGRSGRFYYLDQLAEQPQSWQSPRDAWDGLEQAILNDRPGLLADLARSNEGWQRARAEFNAVIAESVTAWWEMIFGSGSKAPPVSSASNTAPPSTQTSKVQPWRLPVAHVCGETFRPR